MKNGQDLVKRNEILPKKGKNEKPYMFDYEPQVKTWSAHCACVRKTAPHRWHVQVTQWMR